MLASLLPGLRDVRTPLTVGYLWLIILWLLFGDDWPESRPVGDGLVSRVFDLESLVGRGALVAAASFAAYLAGALLSFSLEGRIGTGLIEAATPVLRQNKRTQYEYQSVLDRLKEQLEAVGHRIEPRRLREIDFELAGSTSAETLRTRLLIASESLYGEYDRQAAEANFRINITPPLVMLSWIVASEAGLPWGVVGTFAAFALALQGLHRAVSANEILHRAVIAGVIELPVAVDIKQALVQASGL